MAIALEESHRDLADATAELCRRRAPIARTRAELPQLTSGERGAAWPELVTQGLHALHLPEAVGGAGAGLMELAVVGEQFGRSLLPGPWLPTVLTSAAVASAPDAPRSLLGALAQGASGAVVRNGLVAERDRSGWVVSGVSELSLGLAGADIVLARASVGEAWIWFQVIGGAVQQVDPVDLTRSVGILTLDGHEVDNEALIAVDDAAVDLAFATLLCAEAAGISAWALEQAVEHLSTRRQSGKPLGAFQALQHRAASMLVRREAAVAAAWDAARAEHQPREQWPIAAAQAIATGPPSAADVVFDLITMLGALGITWEHDAHLYWRRAIAIGTALGPARDWVRRLGAVALETQRVARLDDPTQLPELRAGVGGSLDEFLEMPAEDGRHHDPWGRWTGGPRQRLLADRGLIAPYLPPPYGLGAGPQAQAVIADEFARRGLAQPTLIVGDWALATILAAGTEQQKERFLEPSLRGEIIWCQLFSEPEAGSDLASLRARATKVEGGWRLTGQKVWNSRACEAHWGICLARTDPSATRHDGISYFLVDMSAPGVDARPIQQVNGHAELAEVFLDDVFVPDDCLVGEPGDGWRIAMTTLASERLNMGARLKYGAASLVAKVLDDPGLAARRDDVLEVVGDCTAREICLASLNLRTVLGLMSGRQMSSETSVNKVLNATAQRDGSRALLSVLGPLGLTSANEYVMDYLGMPAMLFGGGTIEVQLNVIAARVLGLPRG